MNRLTESGTAPRELVAHILTSTVSVGSSRLLGGSESTYYRGHLHQESHISNAGATQARALITQSISPTN